MSTRSATRISPIFLAVVGVFALTGAILWFVVDGTTSNPGGIGLAVFFFTVSGWVVSLCLHEYAHARVAYASGDRSVALRGYLTLDPRRYVNPLYSIVLPVIFVILGGIGLPGGAVYVQPGDIRGRWRNSLVSLVGPATNALFAAAMLVPIGLTGDAIPAAFRSALAFLGLLQISATILNLIPVPGLDGYGVIEPWLPHELRRSVAQVAPYALIIVFGLLWIPSINSVFFSGVYGVFGWFGADPYLAEVGRQLFRFWQFR
ncbi:hypothetical protein BIV57_08685 [Mangrovactinospora gilvigrisea]|uniref:Site-2 protease family protein n=1 Tax=Mangrovactinospora gilvigrisea TaxID=1428644 RepID=A0A1J7BGW2_9ACTN|nr:site-2 protease family protein [Mangrovactinospora gilvigrisea]OIV37919.1 hypothetical protein BIV57_08685 [Mangrovactinospora gilvigrisea]